LHAPRNALENGASWRIPIGILGISSACKFLPARPENNKVMSPDNKNRPCQEIAADASGEKDPERLLKLTEELIEAIEKRDEIILRKPAAERGAA